MPLFEYVCENCGERQTVLVASPPETVECPKCAHAMERTYSAFTFTMPKGAQA
jgi:putative FmdB family regulatory protein